MPRFTTFKKVTLVSETNIPKILNELSESGSRNKLIIDDVKEAVNKGRTPIILTERAEHVSIITELLNSFCKNVITLIGKMSAKEKREAMMRLHNVPQNEPLIVIATGKYVGEGFDFPRLDTLFIAMPISWKGKVTQYAGRLHRLYDGKEEVLIYDYIDIHIPVLERMYHKRIRAYANLGYKARPLEQPIEKACIIYDGRNYLPVYNSDISHSAKEIVIVSPYVKKNRLTSLIKVLSGAMLNGVSVTIVTRPPEDFNEADRQAVIENIQYLKSSNIDIITRNKISQKFTVIDGRVVWYGSVNFLSFNRNDDCVMRIDSSEVGEALLGSIDN